jgi:hypothetical protein
MITMSFVAYRFCSWCGNGMGTRETISALRGKPTHGICPDCAQSFRKTIPKRSTRFFTMPDDGAEQDFVQCEYARRQKLATIKPISGLDEPEKAFEIAKHRPLPFHVSTNGCTKESGGEPAFPGVHDSSGLPHGQDIVCDCFGDSESCNANAQFIVAACNNHYALLSALERFEQRAIDLGANGFEQEIAVAQEAIKNAKGIK